MSKRDFFHSTPRDIEIFMEEYDKRYKTEAEITFDRMRYSAWLNGLYVQQAVASVLSKKAKYPTKPYGDEDNKVIEATEDMTEEEKDAARKALLENLLSMQEDFNRFHGKDTAGAES